jgi:hypothetical protein
MILLPPGRRPSVPADGQNPPNVFPDQGRRDELSAVRRDRGTCMCFAVAHSRSRCVIGPGRQDGAHRRRSARERSWPTVPRLPRRIGHSDRDHQPSPSATTGQKRSDAPIHSARSAWRRLRPLCPTGIGRLSDIRSGLPAPLPAPFAGKRLVVDPWRRICHGMAGAAWLPPLGHRAPNKVARRVGFAVSAEPRTRLSR